MEDEGTSLAQDVVNPAASDTHIVCGWMVSLEQLAIEGLVWKKLRVLYLIRDRQATSGPAASSRFAKRLAFNLAGLPRELFDDILQLVERDARLQACQDLTFPDQHEGCPCEAFTSNRQKANRKIRLRKARAVWVTSPLTYETPFDLPIQEVQDERLAEFLWEYDRLKLPKACMQSEWTRRSQRQCERLWSMRWESLSHYDFEEPKVLDYWSVRVLSIHSGTSLSIKSDVIAI